VLGRRFPNLSHRVIDHQLANLKSSEHYARIIKEVYDEMKRAKTYDKETLDLAGKAAEAAGNHIPTFDYVGVAQHLKVPAHVDAFRNLATGEGIVAYLTVNGQATVAEKLVQLAEKQGVKELTAKFIRDNFNAQLRKTKYVERKLDAKERARLARESWTNKVREQQHDASARAGRFLVACLELTQSAKDRPRGVTLHITGEFRKALEKAERAIALIHEALGDDLATKEGTKTELNKVLTTLCGR